MEKNCHCDNINTKKYIAEYGHMEGQIILDETYEFKFARKKKLGDYLILNFKEDHVTQLAGSAGYFAYILCVHLFACACVWVCTFLLCVCNKNE